MELLPEDGSISSIPVNSTLFLGRGTTGACSASDQTVSRRHLSLSPGADGGEPRLSVQVVGRNPILVLSGVEGQRRILRPSEKGELRPGDRVSLSLKNPSFLRVETAAGAATGGTAEGTEVEEGVLDAVKRREERTEQRRKKAAVAAAEQEEGRKAEEVGVGEDVWASVGDGSEGETAAEMDFGFEPLDTSQMDAVKEFGFLVRGHEFDIYPRKKVRAVKDWDWFLEDDKAEEVSEEDDRGGTPRQRKSRNTAHSKRRRKSRADGGDDDDEEWTGESEEDIEVVTRGGVGGAGTSTKRTKYATRSSDPRGKKSYSRVKKEGKGAVAAGGGDDDVFRDTDEDEEDETLGGFIVDDEEEELDEADEEAEEEEEEEEFDEDEDDD